VCWKSSKSGEAAYSEVKSIKLREKLFNVEGSEVQ